ncbi:2'-deoxycytidine 5'-triphosphate deaminase [Nisaea nitritireducens]|uniref:2'-deoxycytidine 5'-triphosphate deaminase n=1 Tax=Nisaea nitritireducens TaxID=568392 RepID=UPI001D03333A|nr:2'-deoxycytidine 5'-triphosphate deaminase [Nisaea nitritireducens]
MPADASMTAPDGGTLTAREKRTTGILPSQTIREMIRDGQIASDTPVIDGQIQPSSIDLRLGDEAYRVRASFLPGRNATVDDRLNSLAMHRIDLREGAVLEKGCVYIVRLQESVSLPAKVSGTANPKSSTGRLDIFTRLITDYGTEFESVPEGYEGPLYAEISPRTFSVLARTGSRLNQLRFRRGHPVASDAAMRRLQDSVVLVHGQEADIKEGVAVSVDLTGEPKTGLIGYKAKQHTGLIDIDRPGSYDVQDFWEPLYRQKDRPAELVLDPDEFYILASKEYLSVPLDYAAEMRAYDTKVGEFRVHYAGFFDPGFGMPEAGGEATRGVLEVRSHDVPFVISDGQIVCRLVYEPLIEIPDKIYGAGGIGSNYQGQGLKLGKHFRS